MHFYLTLLKIDIDIKVQKNLNIQEIKIIISINHTRFIPLKYIYTFNYERRLSNS